MCDNIMQDLEELLHWAILKNDPPLVKKVKNIISRHDQNKLGERGRMNGRDGGGK